MKSKLKDNITSLIVISLYLFSSLILQYILKIFNINFKHISNNQIYIYNILLELFLSITIAFIYCKTIINNFKEFKKCHFTKYIRYWLIGLLLMSICNILINMFTYITTSTNQKEIIKSFNMNPLYTTILAVLIAPFLEELVFRLSFRKLIKQDTIFIIISGIFFATMHILNATTPLELLYLIPYTIPGIIFAYTLSKSNNIFVPIFLHLIHNSTMIILQYIL